MRELFLVVVLSLSVACGFLTRGAAATTGGAVGGDPETKRAADEADEAFWLWVAMILGLGYGSGRATEAGAKRVIRARRARKARRAMEGQRP